MSIMPLGKACKLSMHVYILYICRFEVYIGIHTKHFMYILNLKLLNLPKFYIKSIVIIWCCPCKSYITQYCVDSGL